MLAIANNQLDVVKVLVTRGADVVTARTAEGAVLAACICGVHGQDAAVVRRRGRPAHAPDIYSSATAVLAALVL